MEGEEKPLLITPGFPSSVAEFLYLIEPLVHPDSGQAFHVIAPSLPGYAFSTPLGGTGALTAKLRLPYQLTGAQRRVIEEIRGDVAQSAPMLACGRAEPPRLQTASAIACAWMRS